jgi:hypothetical protein
VNLDLRPFVVLWIVCAASVIALFIWRKIVSGKEDDSLHVNSAARTDQTAVAQRLEQIDRWGKVMTVLAVVLGLLVAAAYVYGQFVGRASMGV